MYQEPIPIMSTQGTVPPPMPPQPNPETAPYMSQTPPNMQEMNDLMKYRMAYPEIYYKCQPFVMMACDQMDAFSSEMPTQEMVEKISDNIYDDICRMYPDMAEYVKSTEPTGNPDPPMGLFGREGFGRRFRRRGIFRDFLDFLIFSELFRRRRRFF